MESNMKRLEVDCVTGEVLEIDLTPEEIKAYEKRIADDAKAIADAEAKVAADADAKAALLAKLGITADEAKLLLG
jgi:hypothetical protein